MYLYYVYRKYVVKPKTCRILLLSAFYLKDVCKTYLSHSCICLHENTANNALIIEKNMFNFNIHYVKMHNEKIFALKCIHYDNSVLRP